MKLPQPAVPRPGPLVWMLALVSVAAVVSVFITSQHGVSADTLTYLSTARNLAEGRGFVGADGHVPVEFAPAYPVVLAVLQRLGFPDGTAMALVNVGSLAGLITAVVVGARTQLPKRFGREAVVALVAFGYPIVYVMQWGWSEPMFIALCTGALVASQRSLSTIGGRKAVSIAGAMAAGACLTRYAGFILVGSIALTLLAHRRFRSVLAFLFAALTPPLLWISRNAAMYDSPLGTRGPATIDLAEAFGTALQVVGKWFVTERVGALAMVVPVAMAAALFAFYLRPPDGERAPPTPFAIFVLLYSLAIPFIAAGVTGISPPNDRLLAPLFPALAILILSAIIRREHRSFTYATFACLMGNIAVALAFTVHRNMVGLTSA